MSLLSQHPLRLGSLLLLAAAALSTGLSYGAQAPAAKPESDVLIFKNGDQLTGTLERGTGTSIVFRSEMAGELTVSLDNVKELHTHSNFALLLKGIPLKPSIVRDTIHPGLVTYADSTLTVIAPGGVSSSAAEKNIAFLIDQQTLNTELGRQSIFTGWQGAANAGATDVQGTSFGTTFALGINLVRAMPQVSFLPPHDRTSFDLSETYGKFTEPVVPQTNPATPDNVAKTSIFHADIEHDRYLSPRFYALADASIDHNFSQGLDLQQVYGGGFGWTVLQQPKQQLDLKVDVHYEKQEFNSTVATQNDDLIGSTFTESYRRDLPGKLLLTEFGSVLPAWNTPNAYSANGTLNLAMPAFHRLTVNFGASDSFLNNPPAGYLKNSFQFTTGLGYTFTH